MADVKLFSYDATLPSDQDWVRWLLGDTDVDRAEMDDREIAALLADEAEPEPPFGEEVPTPTQWRAYRATVAARAADAIAAKYAKDSDISFENQRVAMSAKFAQYTALAQRLRAEAHSSRVLKVLRV